MPAGPMSIHSTGRTVTKKPNLEVIMSIVRNKTGRIAAALALDAVSRYLDGGEPRKVIVVPNRIVNIVV